MLHYPPGAELHLQVGESQLPLWQVGIEACLLREPAVLPAGEAAIVVTVGGRSYTYPVVLPHGSNGLSPHVEFTEPARLQFSLRKALCVITALAVALAGLHVAFFLLVAGVYGFLTLILSIAAWQLARDPVRPANETARRHAERFDPEPNLFRAK